MRARLSRARSLGLASLAALAAVACGTAGGRPSEPTAPIPSASSRAPEPRPRSLSVDARKPATLVGSYPRGAAVVIRPTSGRWRSGKGADEVGASGERKLCLGDEARHCIGGDGQFARMSLVVLVSTCDLYSERCPVLAREYVGDGATFEMPVDGRLWLGPNEWAEELDDDEGALVVEVSP